MANNADRPFRFLDLPGELRNKVYELLFCSFGEPTSALDDDNIARQLTISTSSIDTTILRTSSQVHREAHDVMVKTNQLVKVTCTGSLNMDNLLENKRIPTIYAAEAHDSEVKCYAMSIVWIVITENVISTPPVFHVLKILTNETRLATYTSQDTKSH
jgi:hypothetical protein